MYVESSVQLAEVSAINTENHGTYLSKIDRRYKV